jgi:hypothetical protein
MDKIASTVKISENKVRRQRKENSRRREPKVVFNSGQCNYNVITDAAEARGWVVNDEGKYEEDVDPVAATEARKRVDPRSNMFWVDTVAIKDRMNFIQPWQKINHCTCDGKRPPPCPMCSVAACTALLCASVCARALTANAALLCACPRRPRLPFRACSPRHDEPREQGVHGQEYDAHAEEVSEAV